MQDIDYSYHTRQKRHMFPEAQAPRSSNDHSASPSTPSVAKKSTLAPYLIIATLTFSLGIVSGAFLAKAHDIEKSIITHPDNAQPLFNKNFSQKTPPILPPKRELAQNPTKKTITNTTKNRIALRNSFKVAPKESRYLIKVGIYPRDKAMQLTLQLNKLGELQQERAHFCKSIKRNSNLKELAFHIPLLWKGKHKNNKNNKTVMENLLFGCFAKKGIAKQYLRQILALNLPGMRQAKLYEIQD